MIGFLGVGLWLKISLENSDGDVSQLGCPRGLGASLALLVRRPLQVIPEQISAAWLIIRYRLYLHFGEELVVDCGSLM